MYWAVRARPAKGLLRVERLPAALELVAVAVLAEELPDVFDGHVFGAVEEGVGQAGAAVGEAVAMPVSGVEEDLVAGLLDLGAGGEGGEKGEGGQVRIRVRFMRGLFSCFEALPF